MKNTDKIESIKNLAKKLRKNILDMSLYAGSSSAHFGGALSSVEIVSTLFNGIMELDKNVESESRDRFILSKGHGCLVYYAVLAELGYISYDELKTFEKNDSDLLGHPVINRKKGIEFSNGSLGMGLSLGIGVAKALKIKNLKNKVFVLMGDGECNEGSVWESAMSAVQLSIDNITLIIDNNNFQQTGSNSEIMNLGDIKKKWESFGWYTEKCNGHDVENLISKFENFNKVSKPKVLICETIKGKGFKFSENNNKWHHSVLSKSQYEEALKELNL